MTVRADTDGQDNSGWYVAIGQIIVGGMLQSVKIVGGMLQSVKIFHRSTTGGTN